MTQKEKRALLYVLENVESNMKINQDRLPFYLKDSNGFDFHFLDDLSDEQVALFHAGLYYGFVHCKELLTIYFC